MKFLNWVERLMLRDDDPVSYFVGCFVLLCAAMYFAYHGTVDAVTAFWMGR